MSGLGMGAEITQLAADLARAARDGTRIQAQVTHDAAMAAQAGGAFGRVGRHGGAFSAETAAPGQSAQALAARMASEAARLGVAAVAG